MKKGKSPQLPDHMKEGDVMPPAAAFNCEREQYVKEMEAYYQKMTSQPKKEAKAAAKKSLIEAGIIDETGKLTERYIYSRQK